MSRRRWLLAGVALPVSRVWAADALHVTWDGDNIHVSAPQLHFLSGKSLDRVKSGLSVTFLSQISLRTERNGMPFRVLPDRLVVSYDLWEEKFSVARLGGTPRNASYKSAADVEAWSIENLWISASGLAPDRPFWIRLELRVAEPREMGSVMGDSGISLTRLVEIFSRRPGAQDPNWSAEAGPLLLSGLKRVPGRNG